MALVATADTSSFNLWKEQDEQLINVFLKMWDGRTLCCVVNPKRAAITNLGVLEQRVLQYYPNESKHSFYFVTQGKPLNEVTYPATMWNDGITVFVQYRNRGGCFIISFSILSIIIMAIIGSFCTCGSSLLIVPILLPFLFILPLFCL